MSDKETLISFGFSDAKVTRALKATKNSGLDKALDWLTNHADDPEPVEGEDDAIDEDDESVVPGGAEAKSLKCLQCNKIFKNNALASYHGEKSGHDQFEESTEEVKPLTEEEKVAKLAELKERMLEKKKLNAKKDQQELIANLAIQRKAGKDAAQIKLDLEAKEAAKAAVERKNDKILEAKAKAVVRAQIEADKKARADKAAREKALRAGTALPVADAPTPAAPKLAPGEKKVYDSARLQIRLPSGGQPLVTSLPTTTTLAELSKWVAEQPQAAGLESLTFVSTFPRKTYGPGDLGKTLGELGFAPSASLLVQ